MLLKKETSIEEKLIENLFNEEEIGLGWRARVRFDTTTIMLTPMNKMRKQQTARRERERNYDRSWKNYEAKFSSSGELLDYCRRKKEEKIDFVIECLLREDPFDGYISDDDYFQPTWDQVYGRPWSAWSLRKNEKYIKVDSSIRQV